MVTVEQLATLLENGLNANTYGIVFDISADYKEFNRAIRNKKRYENAKGIVYGVLRDTTSTAVPVQNLGHYTIMSNLELAVTTNNLISECLENVYSILQDYYELTIGTENILNSSRIGINFEIPTVNDEKIDNLGGTVNLSLNCTFSITKSAETYNTTKLYIDGTQMTQLINWNFLIQKTQEVVNSADSTINKSIFKNQGIALSIVLPHLTVAWFQNIFNDAFRDRVLNKVYTIKYEDSLHTGVTALTWKMGILNMPISGEPQKANGVSITFAEMRDDLV